MRSQRGLGCYLGALAGPLMLAGLLTGFSAAAPVPAPAPAPVPACQTWTAVPPLNPGTQDNELDSVNVLSVTDAWAVGVSHDSGPEQTLTEHWDGSSWSVVPSPDPGTGNNFLFAVRAASPTDIWAVGSYEVTSGSSTVTKTLILHGDGTSWSQMPSLSPGKAFNSLNAVRVVSANDVWAVGSFSNGTGSRSLILHWNGVAWTKVKSPNPAVVNNLSWVTSTSPTDVWAVGELSDANNLTGRILRPGTHIATRANPRTFIVHWNGTGWSQVPSPSPGVLDFLEGVGATSTSNAWAVGTTLAKGTVDPHAHPALERDRLDTGDVPRPRWHRQGQRPFRGGHHRKQHRVGGGQFRRQQQQPARAAAAVGRHQLAAGADPRFGGQERTVRGRRIVLRQRLGRGQRRVRHGRADARPALQLRNDHRSQRGESRDDTGSQRIS